MMGMPTALSYSTPVQFTHNTFRCFYLSTYLPINTMRKERRKRILLFVLINELLVEEGDLYGRVREMKKLPQHSSLLSYLSILLA